MKENLDGQLFIISDSRVGGALCESRLENADEEICLAIRELTRDISGRYYICLVRGKIVFIGIDTRLEFHGGNHPTMVKIS